MNKAFDKSKYAMWIDPNKVYPYARNAKQHDEKQIKNIANSIRRFGWQQDTVITSDNVLVIGHGRRLAALKLGCEMPYHVIDKTADELTDEDIRELRIADNQTNAETGFDFEMLDAEISDLDFAGFDFDFSVDEQEQEQEEEAAEVVEDDYNEDNLPDEPKAKLGDIYQLGRHRLMCGDSTDKETVDRLMDGAKADMVFTDPPYGNGDSGKYGRGQLGIRTILNDENLDCFNAFISIMPCDRIVYFLQWRTLCESLESVSAKGLKINTVGVWDKKNAGLNGGGGISEQWEAVIFAGNIKYKKFGGNVFTVAREQHKRSESLHPHLKPQELLRQIFDFIDEANIIFDPFGGSGSTLIACEQLNRTCYMMELDPHYVDVIIDRWEKFTGEKAVLLNGE